MTARDSRRSPSGHFKKLRDAGVIDPNDFTRKRDGSLTKASARRIEKIWDSVGAIIANPVARPFHTYKPRKETAKRLRRAALEAGIDPALARVRGVKGVPILGPRGTTRVQFPKAGGISFRLKRGSGIRRSTFRPIDAHRLVKSPKAYAATIERRLKASQAWRIRTGAGWYSPGGDLAAALAYLAEAYDDASEWIAGVEIVDFEEK